MRRLLFSGLFAALVLTGLAAEAEARRLAFVVGVGEYKSLSRLPNPVNDAKAIADLLRGNGFEVAEHYDLNRADFLDALEDFQDRAKGAELAVVYYAGHGMEIAGKDVIAPADMEVSCEPKEARRAIGLDQLFEAAGGAKNQVVLLDACRNDPFPQCPTRAARQGSGFRGLSRISGGDGATLIANATLSGELAADGEPGGHSPFAKALMKRLKASPKSYFRDLLDQVALDVKLATNGVQIPEITTRGGSPLECLSPEGCGGATPAVASDELLGREAAKLLNELGFLTEASPSPQALETAIREFQGKAGMTPDGQATPTLVAVLGATRHQGGLVREKVFTGNTEHAVGSTFRDCDDCPQMVVVPAGEFTMGSPNAEPGRQATEGPQVKVRIARPFAVSKLEITYDQWETCALEGGCNGYRPKDAGSGRGDRPVAYISWEDAKAYVEWLRQRTGEPYRLLSEAEWEYAARANTTGAFATGDMITTEQANFDGTQAGTRKIGQYLGEPTAAGSYQPNPFGLFDTHGNLAEWVEDCWNPSHAGAMGAAAARGGDCERRVVKGGAWYFEASYLRSAARMSYPKAKRLNIVGFRVARDLN